MKYSIKIQLNQNETAFTMHGLSFILLLKTGHKNGRKEITRFGVSTV